MRNKKEKRRDKKAGWIGLGLALAMAAILLAAIIAPRIHFAHAGGGTVTVNGWVTVGTTCTFTTSNAAINFGTITVGTNSIGTTGNTLNNYAVMNVITVTNTGTSAIGSNVMLSASNWNYNANTFSVSNTIWSGLSGNNLWGPVNTVGVTAKSQTSNVEYAMAGVSIDTMNTVAASGTATFWYGVNVPSTLTSGAYAQTINVISSC